MEMHLEREWKSEIPDEGTLLGICEDARNHAIPGIEVADFEGPFSRGDLYLDTESRTLLVKGMLCRVSLSSGPRPLAERGIVFKTPTSDPSARREYVQDFEPRETEYLHLGRLRGPAMDAAREAAEGAELATVLRVTKLYWTFGDLERWECALGYVLFGGARGAMERFDLEVEVRDSRTRNARKRAERAARTLRDRYGLREDPRSKYAIGMAEVG